MSKQTSVVEKRQTVSLQNPSAVMEFSNQLKEIIVKNHLYTNVKGKNYVNVEGWQIAGAFTGIEPIVEKVENISDDKTIRYRAEVALYDTKRDGVKCGMGMAICTNKEAGKQGFEEFAVASMAQTRAIGKAFRLKLGWLMKLAGYEPTPAEEVEEAKIVRTPRTKLADSEPVRDEQAVADAIEKINSAKDRQELLKIWFGLDKLKLDKEVIAAKDAKKEELK